MAWPKIVRRFQSVPNNADENDFYGPYNKLLNYLFPVLSDFTVVPQYQQPGSLRAPDWFVEFEVFFNNYPVFILELKKPTDIRYVSKRDEADEQIRRRLADLRRDCPIPKLHAVSAMGPRLCFYHVDTTNPRALIVPHVKPRDPDFVNDAAPEEWWNCDVLNNEGEERFRAVADEIKQACAGL
ncbi:uncharacterized protein FOMMEDRAFT_25505 [Fomitiporia mediterranea MF3/22]|uniref:uncharacterized protein n=1 Tax=Fomitiporia mediterranea (strain MF3/22) TaxID=694068 RepID=UPI00044090EE|nr:uncharacterized protein FOMMEDRAFT_25505 [Fomitiporia mediterranea MF3/22]EJD08434.1 hypothetical protein FOMMEDRAFT_25505 [Fomitiporia mediterranea MF3/22]